MINPTARMPGRLYAAPFWDYGLLIGWIIYRNGVEAETFSEQGPDPLRAMSAMRFHPKIKITENELLERLIDGHLGAFVADMSTGASTPIASIDWAAVRHVFDERGIAYLARSSGGGERGGKMLRFLRNDALKLWPENSTAGNAAPARSENRKGPKNIYDADAYEKEAVRLLENPKELTGSGSLQARLMRRMITWCRTTQKWPQVPQSTWHKTHVRKAVESAKAKQAASSR